MYNRQEVFKKHIQKKAEELNDLCKTLGVVSFMSFAVKDNGVSTDYKNYIYGSAANGIRLSDAWSCKCSERISDGSTRRQYRC